MQMKKQIGVIGGGAAGMMAAITAAKEGAQVTILERNDRVGKKILQTGNGKCNLGNRALSVECYHGGDLEWIRDVLEHFDTEDTIRFLTERAIPVCGHLGLTPQSVHQFGGYRVQGKTEEDAERIIEDAKILQDAGASIFVLEAIPSQLGKRVTEAISVPTIGIGAGPDCSGQVLVMHDMLNVYPGKKARFVRNFMEGQTTIEGAIKAYVAAVKDGTFPAEEHCF